MAGSDRGTTGMDRHGTARDRVDHEHAGFVDPGVIERRAEELTGPPDERAVEPDLVFPWCLADENQR
jgi:hypothetical protein